MKEHPILFQGWKVRAIYNGATQTRRVIRKQPAGAWAAPGRSACPYGQPGDLLWVRETWAIEDCGSRVSLSPGAWPSGWPIDRLRYPATDEAPQKDGKGRPYWWNLRSSIHMPRWASRLTLRLTEVLVQRVQEISHEDMRAEGMQSDIPFVEFIAAWDSINSKRPGCSWEANPFCWALTFVVERTGSAR